MSSRSAAAWVAAFAALVIASTQLIDTGGDAPAGDSSSAASPAPAKVRTAKVLRVVDGDTIVVRATGAAGGSGDKAERVRYIGVDTPESVKENTPVECFGHEASEANRRLVEGKSVRLLADREPRDKYGRTLAFVYAGDSFVNAELLRGGYARTIEVPPNTSKAVQFASIQTEARRAGRGLWSECRR